jgi:hypothetical protein
MKSKLMSVAFSLFLAFMISLFFLALQNNYFDQSKAIAESSPGSFPTKWEKVDSSFSGLLDSGWQISGHSSSHAAFRVVNDEPYNKKGYTFLLAKSSKYIMCFIENPFPPSTNSICRRLN